jgi:aspartyl-tRNA synthetase
MEKDKLTGEMELLGLEVVIGIETHIRLNTSTKLFCTCPNSEDDRPNHNICSVCTGQMGVLPAVNKEAVRKAVAFGKAIKSSMRNTVICWDRKHYEYPDLPKNFQLTQFRRPVIPDGMVECYRNDGSTFVVDIEQVHIEEDAAKLIHEQDKTLVDFNKAGVPLIEVVTKPCIRKIADAPVYAQYLHRIVQNLEISEANLEKGQFKSDVSVSLRKKGTDDLNPRAEIKNLNSFKFMHEAILEEVRKQLGYFKKHDAFRPDQTTVLFDAELKKTRTMRKKEYAADYRFAVEPDIPMTDISSAVDQIRVDTGLLPFPVEKRLIEGGVRPQDAKFFTSDPVRSRVFLGIDRQLSDPLFVARTLTNNLKVEDYGKVINIVALADILTIFRNGKISVVLLQKAISELLRDPAYDFQSFFNENVVSEEKLHRSIREAIEGNPDTARQIESGDVRKAGILVGKVVEKVGSGVSGKVIRERILSLLSEVKKAGGEIIGESEAIADREAKVDDTSLFTSGEDDNIRDCYRTHLISDISADLLSHKVILAGWVSSLRDHGELLFIDLRDTTNELFQLRLNRVNFPDLDQMARINPESVIMVTGTVISRSEDDFNPGIRTGGLELDTTKLEILNSCRTLPFEIRRASGTSELIRLKYKFLDQRNSETRKVIINRHKVIKAIRDFLDNESFIEIETPVLTAGTDEGAREFIVPSRKFHGKFYTLPQAPQQFKQMLMLGGFPKYFQIARCFRDEDSRGDRQPEFTQLDMELAFSGMKDILDLNTRLLEEIVRKIYGKRWRLYPFRTLTYREAMEKYGTDRPDLRFGLEMLDITHILKGTPFKIFATPIARGGIVKCIRVSSKKGRNTVTKGQIEKLTYIAQANGLGGLAYIVVRKDELQSPIIKYLGEGVAERIIQEAGAGVGDIVFFSASDAKTANKALDAVRQELGRMLHLIRPRELHPAWIVDFPLFEKTDKGGWTFSHNPFSMPVRECLQDHMRGNNIGEIIAQQYDLILNGNEIGGGSVRAHKPEILAATYRNMGYSNQEMIKSIGHMYEAFHYGAPPHGGIAWGLDRLLMILENRSSIREVMAFPKTGAGEDLLFNCPSELSDKKIIEANIRIIDKS